jgi:hypothetical protein
MNGVGVPLRTFYGLNVTPAPELCLALRPAWPRALSFGQAGGVGFGVYLVITSPQCTGS